MTAPQSLDPSHYDESARLAALNPLLLAIGDMNMAVPINERGVASLTLPPKLVKNLGIPGAVDHAKDWESRQKFSEKMATIDGHTDRTGLLLWLSPNLPGNTRDATEISPEQTRQWQKMATDHAAMLGMLFGIPLEARIFTPGGALRHATREHLSIGLVLASPQQHATTLQNEVYDEISAMRTRAQEQHSWQQYPAAPEAPKEPTGTLDNYDPDERFDLILSHSIADPRIEMVPGNGAPLILRTPRYTPPSPPPHAASPLHAEPRDNRPTHKRYQPQRHHEPLSVNPRDNNNTRFPTHALVLWLDPKYNLPTGEGYDDAKKLSDDEIGDFCCSANLMYRMNLDCHLEQPSDPQRPCALVIYADSPTQHADLIRLQSMISMHRLALGRDTPESQAR